MVADFRNDEGLRIRKESLSPALYSRKHSDTDPTTMPHMIVKPVLTPDRPEQRQEGRRMKEDGEPMFTLTGQDQHGIFNGMQIRRLTPTECERLQGFPDGWTTYGIFGEEIKEISDSQRYKCLGNAVTTNVITEVIKRMF
jgi:DNA (cytosine-5)-methyltransferase 1